MKLRNRKTATAAEVDPNGDFERAYAEAAGTSIDDSFAATLAAELEKREKQETIVDLIKERGGQHGDWRQQSCLSQSLKTVMGIETHNSLRPDEREALEMIAVKLSRILCGDAHLEDHWRDIAGYATLAADQNKLSA